MGIVSVASFAGSSDLLPSCPQARLCLARGYILAPAGAGSLSSYAYVAWDGP